MKRYRFYLKRIAKRMVLFGYMFTLKEIKDSARSMYNRDRIIESNYYGWECEK